MNNAETDPAVRAIIVTGTGKVFCAGEEMCIRDRYGRDGGPPVFEAP